MIRVICFGLLTWLIPFAASIPLYGRDGRPAVPPGVFKSLMVVIGSAAGAILLLRLFRRGRPLGRRSGVAVGLAWLAINLGLDLLILVPLTGMGLPEYLGEIGLRYLTIPIMSVAIDAAARPGEPSALRRTPPPADHGRPPIRPD